jgi:hypothetical protein
MQTAKGQLQTDECRMWVVEEKEETEKALVGEVIPMCGRRQAEVLRRCVTVREEGTPTAQT